MTTIPGVGTTHVPYLMNAPQNMLLMRRLLCAFAERLSGRPFQEPPEALAEFGDQPEKVAFEHHRLHWEAFATLRRYVDDVSPDAILLIGDDQAQCFRPDNLPPYAMYVGETVAARPFHMSRFPGDDEYVKRTWGVDVEHVYHWPCHAELAVALRDGLLAAGFGIASTNDLARPGWTHGLGHAHANTQVFLRNDDGRIPIIPLFVNCYGPDLGIFDAMAPGSASPAVDRSAYPRAPSSSNLYAMGRAIREILESRPETVLVCPSSTWSHTWLTSRYHRMRMDVEGNREKLGWLVRGEGSRFCDYDSPDLEANGDHELRNWIVAAGVMGERPLDVVLEIASWVSTGYRVFGTWR